MSSSKSNRSLKPLLGWLIITFFYAYQYILRVLPSVLISDITQKFSLTPETFGQFSGVYYLGYSLAHIPIGIALDRIGPKKTVPLFILMAVFGLFPLLWAKAWIYPVLGRFLMGIGSSGAILGVFKVVQILFEEKKFSRMLSFSVTIGLCGAIYGGGPLHIMRAQYGFNSILIALAIAGIALSAFAFLLIPASTIAPKKTSVLADLQTLFKNREVLSLCFLAGLMVGPLEGFADVWGTQFLKITYGLDAKIASTLPSFIFIGMCFGGPLLSYLSERKENHLNVVLGSAIMMMISFILMLTMQVSTAFLTPVLFMVGICCGYQILMIYKISTLTGPGLSGLSTAVANMIIMVFGYVFHSSIGKVVGLIGHIEDPASLTMGISIIPFSLALSAIGLAFYLVLRRNRRLMIVNAG